MRCHKPNTDQACEVFISAGGKQYAEYSLISTDDEREPKPNVFECFIPVSNDEQITVNINFAGTVLHGAADVLADGAFVFDRRIEGDRKGKLKYQKRHWKIEEVYNVPHGFETPDIMQTGQAVVAGNLFVKSLNDDEVPLYVRKGGKLGLGSIAVIISINQDTEENYMQSYKHQTVGKWRDIRSNHADGGIKPLHELEFRLEDDEVHFNRQQRHKRHGEQTRFGLKPWAMFVFYYRPQTVIHANGCPMRSSGSFALDPFLGDFTFADPDAIIKKRLASRAQKEREKMKAAAGEGDDEGEEEEEEEAEEDEDVFGYDGHETYSTEHSVNNGRGQGSFIPCSPNQSLAEAAGQELYGNQTSMQGEGFYPPRKDSRISADGMGTFGYQGNRPHGDWQDLFGDAALGDNAVDTQAQGVGTASDWHQNSFSGHYQGRHLDPNFYADLPPGELAGEIEQIQQGEGFHAPQPPFAAPTAKMVASPPAKRHPDLVEQPGPVEVAQSIETMRPQQDRALQQHPQESITDVEEEEHAEPPPLAELVSSAVQHEVTKSKAEKAARIEAKTVKKVRPPPQPKGKPVFDPTAKTGYGFGKPKTSSAQAQAPTQANMQQLNAQEHQMQGMLQDYLKAQKTQQQHTMHPKSSPQNVPYTRPWETARPAPPTQNAMSPPARLALPNTRMQNAPAASPQPTRATPAASIPRKRSASITSHNSASSTNKKADFAARKAAMLAQLEAARRAKEAAEKELEAQRRAREEMDRMREQEERLAREAEEAEEAELAALEAQLKGAGAEVEAIREVGRKEAEEARMRELERGREGEE